jgi:two-component system alkaline phosphatase synthesis response regulator PhoP
MSPEITSTPKAVLRPLQMSEDVYDDGYLRVEYENYYVACNGETINLPRKEFLLFSHLARRAERVVPVAELWRCAWGKARLNVGSLQVHIYRLRRRLAPYNLHIETMINVGYRLKPRRK